MKASTFIIAALSLSVAWNYFHRIPESNLSHSEAFYEQAIRDAYRMGQESIILQAIETKDGWEIASR